MPAWGIAPGIVAIQFPPSAKGASVASVSQFCLCFSNKPNQMRLPPRRLERQRDETDLGRDEI